MKDIVKAILYLLVVVIIATGCKKEQLAEVLTSQVTNITSSTAIGGGTVVSDGESTIIERGVCWGEFSNPTIDNYHATAGSGIGSFICEMTGLKSDTYYYVRAYVLNNVGISYGSETSFRTTANNGGGNGGGGTYNGHNYVDLGLPSGTLWATCNVGASIPEGYGNYYAWGETTIKDIYDWNTYKYGHLENYELCLTKYNTCSDYGLVDNLTMLQADDDAATVNWGNGWQMPTKEQWQELYDNTMSYWTIQNGVNGRLFTTSNGQSLFLPAAGGCEGELYGTGRYGYYYSNSLSDYPGRAWILYFLNSGECSVDEDFGTCNYRFRGSSIRPVRSSK